MIALAPNIHHLLSCRASNDLQLTDWPSIVPWKINSLLTFNKHFLCFFMRLPFSVWHFLFWTNLRVEGGGGQPPPIKNFTYPGQLLHLLAPLAEYLISGKKGERMWFLGLCTMHWILTVKVDQIDGYKKVSQWTWIP